MNNASIEAVRSELGSAVIGRRFGRVFPLPRRSIAVDLGLKGGLYLFISVEPKAPRAYLIRRKLKELERSTEPPQPFHLMLRKHLSGAEVVAVEKLPNERVLLVRLSGIDELGIEIDRVLAAQLTGRSADVFLLDENGIILSSLIKKETDGQRVGDVYVPPHRAVTPDRQIEKNEFSLTPDDKGSISSALDRYYQEREADERFRSISSAAKRKVESEIEKRSRLIERLRGDLKRHGDADRWKRYGDLILANLANAERRGNSILVPDLFDPSTPVIEIEGDENSSLTDVAQSYFKRYAKAQSAHRETSRRIGEIESEIVGLGDRLDEIVCAIDERNEAFFVTREEHKQPSAKRKEKARFTGARRFTSSDGFEILVGKKASDNDHLTFRIAGPLDLWMHAADYPGSHVVVRNPNRKDVPQRTLLEAAQLAAFYSSGRSQPKAAVHYTQKKFVNKPKRSAPGLVSMASFKTLLVEPAVPVSIETKS